uniref:Glycosyltransferase subfamily 4-like N-terminal domain-containing protein n=1 Tax=Aureoumbra lagunensis TaxID=44058 RepID=A0A7S3NPD0_9STRA|mmetsp:Transcript_7442/g.11121  ORF Transcript_7442/g.11121 Transcript_7442/m.11121 type:complete len:591 (+) Transcript_7442:48-1820(+)
MKVRPFRCWKRIVSILQCLLLAANALVTQVTTNKLVLRQHLFKKGDTDEQPIAQASVKSQAPSLDEVAIEVSTTPPSVVMQSSNNNGVLSTRPAWLRPKTMAVQGAKGVGRIKRKMMDRISKRQSTPMKVALLVEPTPFTHVCGYANRFQEMLKYMKEFGDHVHIATPDDKLEAPNEFMGFPVKTLRGQRFPLYPEVLLSLDSRGEARKMVQQFKPDIIHVSSPGFLAMSAALYAKALNIPLVMSYHTHLPVYAERYMGYIPLIRKSSWQYIKMLHSFADLTLVTSPQVMEEFREQGIRRVAVWRKGVDVDTFNPKHSSAQIKANILTNRGHEKDTVLLYVGRLSVEKRLEQLDQVLDDLKDDSVSLALVGGGPHEDALKKHFAKFGDRVKFCGILRGDTLSAAYASADIFVMPSDSETLGFVVIEAMASGLAVVGAKAGGIPSIVDDDSNGMLAPPRDPKAFSHAVKSLVRDSNLQNRLKAQARLDAESWGWKQATRHLRDVHYIAAIRRHSAIKRLTAKDRRILFKLPFISATQRRAIRLRFAFLTRDLKSFFNKTFYLAAVSKLLSKFTNRFFRRRSFTPPPRIRGG